MAVNAIEGLQSDVARIDGIARSGKWIWNNLLGQIPLYSVNRPYAVNGLNQYTSAGPAAFAYDANGNLAGDGRTGFAYDGENRLVSASGGQTAVLRYDPLGRLYEVAGRGGITRFLWDGDALLAEYDAGGTLLRRYVHGADARADDPVAWYEGSAIGGASERLLRADRQGSILRDLTSKQPDPNRQGKTDCQENYVVQTSKLAHSRFREIGERRGGADANMAS